MTKPRVAYADLAWFSAFNRFKVLPQHSKLVTDAGEELGLDYVMDAPYPPALWLRNSNKEMFILRQGDPMIHELRIA